MIEHTIPLLDLKFSFMNYDCVFRIDDCVFNNKNVPFYATQFMMLLYINSKT